VIGFGDSEEGIARRVRAFNTAFLTGHEIASHSAGHFNGLHWSADEWRQEFTSFKTLIANVQHNNPNATVDQPLFSSTIEGFRAPDLGVNSTLYATEKEFGMRYDASGVGSADGWPYKDSIGIWHIPLGVVYLGPSHHAVLAMDYSLRQYQTNGRDTLSSTTPAWHAKYQDVLDAYMNAFAHSYSGNRAPIVIGNHFVKMNDSLYWEAMKSFAEQVCGQPQVRCVTFSELTDYLDAHGVPTTH